MNNTPAQRLIALDVFRGLTIALMFIVNNPGTWSHVYAPLLHAHWHGWTPTDWVFPFFLFTVGVSAWFSLKKYAAGHAPKEVYFKIIKRGIIIFLIGLGLNLYLNSLSSYENLRIMGVLQRIGLAYLIGSLICVSFSQRTVAIIGGAILVGYWLLVRTMSDGALPFGLYDGHDYLGLKNNIVTLFDVKVLGSSHLYKGYGGIPFDPEGVLSTLPAIVSVILGYFTGKLIDTYPDRKELVKKMYAWGFATLFIGWAVGGFYIGEQSLIDLKYSQILFPVNKPIWSPTYVVFMAGWCLVINAFLIWLIDVAGLKGWTKPILVLGMNSMLAFIISGMYVKTINKIKFDSSYETVLQKWDNQTVPKQIGGSQKLYEDVFSPITTPYQMLKDVKDKKITEKETPSVYTDFKVKQKLSSFLFALFHVVLFWFILWIFYKNNIFLKI
jgi:predicted acyltransferase